MNCTDIGTIQAFLDGELTHSQSSELSGHISVCDACAVLLADAETESAMVFGTLERELDTLVPTQRLWNKINDSIEIEKAALPWWSKLGVFVSAAFTSPSLSAAAAVLIFAVIGGAFWFNRTQPTTQAPSTVAITTPTKVQGPVSTSLPPFKEEVPTSVAAIIPSANRRPMAVPAGYRMENMGARLRLPVRAVVDKTSDDSGEESYVTTIASLNKTVRGQKDMTLRPSERVAFERDLALVDDSISKMRTEVKKNPKNDSARQVLYTSYQNKIDLLNSVAQKEELVASLK